MNLIPRKKEIIRVESVIYSDTVKIIANLLLLKLGAEDVKRASKMFLYNTTFAK